MKYLKKFKIVIGLFALIFVVIETGIADSGQERFRENKNYQQPESDDLKSEVRDVSGFSNIAIGGTIGANITVGQDFKVIVEAKEDVLPKIVTKVEDDTLKVNFEKNWWKSFRSKYKNTKVRVTITLPILNDLDVSGASKVSVSGINNDKLKIDVSGASNVSIKGSARELIVDLSGASNLMANDLLSEVAEMELSGASNAKVNVTDQLRVEASGASSVRYAGNPQVRKDTSGASSVKRL